MTPGPEDTHRDDQRAALLGHDIRNAVSDIIGGLSLANLTGLDPESQQQLQRVRSASEQLARLSDEMMALVLGDHALATLPPKALCLRRFLSDIEARFAAQAHAAGIEFTLEMAPDIPSKVGSDKGAMERILANLLGNAIKHAGSGEVTLSVNLRSHETLALQVRDTGKGFSDQALATLFEAGGGSTGSETRGSGLGLHIAYELADQLGGRIEVANHQLGGAKVALLLPRAAWAPGLSDPSRASDPLPDLSGTRVLIAEDNKTNQLLACQMLDTLGAECAVAADGVTALAMLEQDRFDLALIDIEMPRLSGLDLIRVLREREAESGQAALPILAVTAYVLRANRDEIYDAGADGILAKPIMSVESFAHAICDALAHHHTGTSLPDVGADKAPVLNALHLDRLLALAGETNGRELLTRLREDFETVQSGLNMAVRPPDYALLRARSHVLISLAGAVGSDHLQGMAETLNRAAHSKDHSIARVLTPRITTQIARVLEHLESEYSKRFGGAVSNRTEVTE